MDKIMSGRVDEPVIRKIGMLAEKLYRKWNPRHGTHVNDVILAATAIQNGGRIYTLNIKQYPMPEVVAQKAWSS